MEAELYVFKDDGVIPNSKYPVLVYRNAVQGKGEAAASWLEETFAKNGWTNNWRWGVYDFHHYHSNTFEVLGVFQGNAVLKLGGEQGKALHVNEGDVLILPPGTGHQCISGGESFQVVGAYPHGIKPDLRMGVPEDRTGADENIRQVAEPDKDPVTGSKYVVATW